MRRTAAVLIPVVFVGLVSLAACSSSGSSTPTTQSSGAGASVPAATGEPEGTTTITGLVQTHVDTPVKYPQTPPVGGPHSPVWQTCRFYGTQILNEHAVHSMEHGAVWVTFSPDLPAAQVGLLKKLATTSKKILVSPYAGLPSPVVASAWGKQLQLQSADDPRLAQFAKYFADGPQTPEPGATCEGGTTETAN